MNGQPTTKPRLRPLGIAVIAIAIICFAEGMSHGPELVYPLPEPWRSLVLVAGFLAGGALAFFALNRSAELTKFQKFSLAIGVPILSMMIASYYARRAVEVYAFMNVTPAAEQVFAPIVRMSSRRVDSATILSEPAAREIRVFVTTELWLRLDPYRHPGRDCLILVQQTGSNGIKRLMVPGIFDDEIDTVAFRQCSAA